MISGKVIDNRSGYIIDKTVYIGHISNALFCPELKLLYIVKEVNHCGASSKDIEVKFEDGKKYKHYLILHTIKMEMLISLVPEVMETYHSYSKEKFDDAEKMIGNLHDSLKVKSA